MKGMDSRLLNFLIEKDLAPQVFTGDFGLEKENIRVDKEGKLALTPHPKQFGDKLVNPYIKIDFSESQIEVVTPVCGSLEEVYAFLENLQNIVSLSLDEEYLWPQSSPPALPNDEEIPIAIYENGGNEERKYRERLAAKYGRKKQLLCGIHFNFSFKEDFIKILYAGFGINQSYKDFKNATYLKVTRNFLKYRWLLLYLTGASPVFHNTFQGKSVETSEKLDDESSYFKDLSSLRNSKCGYRNNEDFVINYDSVEEYVNSIQALINDGKIDSPSEFYSPIRLKGSSKNGALQQLNAEGIKYLEIRLLDLNPFNKNGISLEDLYLINLFAVYMFLKEDRVFDAKQQEISNRNHDLSAVVGRQDGATIYNELGELVNLRREAIEIVDDLAEIVKILNVNVEYLTEITETAREKILDPKKTYAHRIIEETKDKSYIGFHMGKAQEYLQDSKNKEFNLVGYEDLELSTQILIKDAIRRGIVFDLLDRDENFIRLSRGPQIEYVKQATKTGRDSYITVLIMENKVVTKEILKENDLIVPDGKHYNKIEDAKLSYDKFKASKIVIKPKSTNFGIGISIFKEDYSKDEFERALEIAFEHDKTILVEDFISGKEYRFLVINDEVVGILCRVPANVQGDGKKTIRELVEEKNQNPLRGKGYRTPLEKISCGEIEEMFLKSQGKNFDYIASLGEDIFLRENSNISTGGDSIDYTDCVHESYKDIAVKSAKAVGAFICGVDMMIEDIEKQQNNNNYAIIELNFNPAIHIHCYPYKGSNRRVGEKLLDLLFEMFPSSNHPHYRNNHNLAHFQ